MAEITVETFEQVERDAATGIPECVEEQKELIEKLDLVGQKELFSKPKTEDTGKVVNPYPQMTREQMFVYKKLFPREMGVKDYKRSPIPVRVLQVIAFCDEHQLFDRGMSIWCQEGPIDKDPILVGQIDWQEYCLLARWGDALEAYDVLKQRACELHKVTIKEALLQGKAKVDAMLDRIDNMAWELFCDRDTPSIYNID